jgi:hypothetical protein
MRQIMQSLVISTKSRVSNRISEKLTWWTRSMQTQSQKISKQLVVVGGHILMAGVVVEVAVVGGLIQMAVAMAAEVVVVVVEVIQMVVGVITTTPITNQEAIIATGVEVVAEDQVVMVVQCITGKAVLMEAMQQ